MLCKRALEAEVSYLRVTNAGNQRIGKSKKKIFSEEFCGAGSICEGMAVKDHIGQRCSRNGWVQAR